MHLLRKPESKENALRPLFSFRFSQKRDSRPRGHGMLRISAGDGFRVRRSWKLLWEGMICDDFSGHQSHRRSDPVRQIEQLPF
jgi:hypothetical protein